MSIGSVGSVRGLGPVEAQPIRSTASLSRGAFSREDAASTSQPDTEVTAAPVARKPWQAWPPYSPPVPAPAPVPSPVDRGSLVIGAAPEPSPVASGSEGGLVLRPQPIPLPREGAGGIELPPPVVPRPPDAPDRPTGGASQVVSLLPPVVRGGNSASAPPAGPVERPADAPPLPANAPYLPAPDRQR